MKAYITPCRISNNYFELEVHIKKRPNRHEKYVFILAGLNGIKAEIEAENILIRANPDANIDRQVYLNEIREQLKTVPQVVVKKSRRFEIYLDRDSITNYDVDGFVAQYLGIKSIKWERIK